MGRFASTVEYYARYREPYPAGLFAEIARRLGLSGRERLLDAGCGPAPLAIGFAPYVAALTGIDPEPQMLEVARTAAREAGVRIDLLHGRIEELPADAGRFDLVTIGRALHWMDPAATRAVLEGHVAEGGAIAVCGSSADPEKTPWLFPFRDFWMRWSDEPLERYKLALDDWFAPSRFRRLDEIRVSATQKIPIEHIVGRALSLSVTSPEKLGDRRDAFERELAAMLAAFAKDGMLEETNVGVATLFR